VQYDYAVATLGGTSIAPLLQSLNLTPSAHAASTAVSLTKPTKYTACFATSQQALTQRANCNSQLPYSPEASQLAAPAASAAAAPQHQLLPLLLLLPPLRGLWWCWLLLPLAPLLPSRQAGWVFPC
jgi:hypothetical protein